MTTVALGGFFLTLNRFEGLLRALFYFSEIIPVRCIRCSDFLLRTGIP